MEEVGYLGCNGCFQLVFFVIFVFEDGIIVVVDSCIVICQVIWVWIQDNGCLIQCLQFVYFFDVILRDGMVQIIVFDEDLCELVQGC